MNFFYLHVPKAGGTTLNHILDRKFRNSRQFKYSTVTPEQSMNTLKKMTAKEKKKIKLVRGHFVYGFHSWFEIADPKYFTILRDPVQRVASHYYYSARKENHYLFNLQQSKKVSLIEYVSNICPEVQNGVTKQIAGAYVNDNFGYGRDILDIKDQNVLYEVAMENIQKHFVMIGITEMFDKTIALLKKLLGGGGQAHTIIIK